jgi:methionyl-tRNA formyltransferase
VTRSVIVLGKGTLAVRVAGWLKDQAEWHLAGVVPVMPEPVWTNSLTDWALQQDVPVVESGRAEDVEAVLGRSGSQDHDQLADLAVSVFYDRILRAAFLNRVGRAINIHNAPLPHYRGVSPINWALKDGQRSHGVTIHEITPGIDDGPILSQTTFSIYPESDEVVDVYRRALAYGWQAFLDTIERIDDIVPVAQGADVIYHSHADDHLLDERRGFTIAESVGAHRRRELDTYATRAVLRA